MAKRVKPADHQARSLESVDPLELLVQHNFLFKGIDPTWLTTYLQPEQLVREKFYSNRPIYTAYRPNTSLENLYILVEGGPVVMRSAPLDRIIAITYPGGCFGMQNLDFGCGKVVRAFPSLVEAHKTTDVIKIPLGAVQAIYADSEIFQERYGLLFELREKFQYHLLNCSTYPPQRSQRYFEP